MKKIIAIILSVMMMCALSLSVNATGIGRGCGDYPIIATQPTPDMPQQAIDKINRNIVNPNSNLSIASNTWHYLPGAYTCYTQLEGGYCMAACAQSTIKYLTGTVMNQYTIASELALNASTGGDFNDLAPYLNEKQDVNFFVQFDSNIYKDDLQYDLYNAITIFEVPATLRIVTYGSPWAYSTQGHAANVTGIREDREVFRIADPLIKRINSNGNPVYTQSADTVYNAVTADEYCGYIY